MTVFDADGRIKKMVNDFIEQYPGIVTKEQANGYINSLVENGANESEVLKQVEQRIKEFRHRMSVNDISTQPHYDLNELLDCRISNNALHIHVVPKSLKEQFDRGIKQFLHYVNENLDDAFTKIVTILKQEEIVNVNTICAVSPLLSSKVVQKLFISRGFDVSITDDPQFVQMFGGQKVGMATMNKEKFLERFDKQGVNSDIEVETKPSKK